MPKKISGAEALRLYNGLMKKKRWNRKDTDLFYRVQEKAFIEAPKEAVREAKRQEVKAKVEARRKEIQANFNQFQGEMVQLIQGTIKNVEFNPTNVGGLKKAIEEIVKFAVNKQIVIGVGEKHISVNHNNLPNILQAIHDEFEVVEEDMDSYRAFIHEIIHHETLNVFINEGFDRKILAGAFFPYTHKTDLDLSRYGIFRWVNKENYNVNCFHDALMVSGLPTSKLERLKQMITGVTIPTSRLKLVCDTLLIRINLRIISNKQKRMKVYGKEYEETYELCLHEKHYFVYDMTTVTSYAIKNYDKVKGFENWGNIRKVDGTKIRRDNSKFIDSLELVTLLIKLKDTLLEPIKLSEELYSTVVYEEILNDEFESLEYTPDCIKYHYLGVDDLHLQDDNSTAIVYERLPDEVLSTDGFVDVYDPLTGTYIPHKKAWFDFETNTNFMVNGGTSIHAPYLCCLYIDGEKKNFSGPNCARKLLYSLTGPTFLIAHNAGYDFRFITAHLCITNYVPKNNSLFSCDAIFYKSKTSTVSIRIHDSYKLITSALSNFGDMFNLPITKEVIPYSVYTTENIAKVFVPISEALQDYKLKKEKDRKIFQENLDKWGCRVGDKFNILEYSRRYCEMDCEVLHKGYQTFRGLIHQVTGLNVDNYVSIASLANDYLIKQGCYDGVCQMSGVPRAFIQRCIVGGRTMMSENKKRKMTQCQISDFDAVSLYPSAMTKMGGFLKGPPKVLTKDQCSMKFLKGVDGYFIRTIIKKVGKHLKFPLLSHVTDGVRVFTNEMEGKTVYLDRFSLEDAIKFQKIEFEIVEGYYFNDGRNNKIQEVMTFLFNERNKQKKAGNPIQEVYKLLMNSAYGKSILKPINEEYKIFNSDEKYYKFTSRNFQLIKDAHRIVNGKWCVRMNKAINEHFNSAQVGCEVLSYSKRIMNRVMVLAEDNDIDIYYQDTDSMHMDEVKVKSLDGLYKGEYGTELIGEDLGQFHVDFKVVDEDGKKIKCSRIVSVKFIALGKKAYIDVLEGTDMNGKVHVDYHVRMKGISAQALQHQADSSGLNLYQLYEKHYDGEAIEYDLRCGGQKFIAKYNQNMTITTPEKFPRIIKF